MIIIIIATMLLAVLITDVLCKGEAVNVMVVRRPEPVVYYFNPEYTQTVRRSYTRNMGYILVTNA